ncbi:MAG: hypothetical protein ACLSCV_10270 [Acutalibacteraceae bacterium]
MSIIQNAELQIRKQKPDFSIEDIPMDDKKTFAMIASGATERVSV